jgi:hypothetical protein
MLMSTTLNAYGYRAIFHIACAAHSAQQADVVVEVRLDNAGASIMRSMLTSVATSDLQRLGAYFDEHISLLAKEPGHVSEVFVPLQLGFQIQALSGEIDSNDDGVFGLRVMVSATDESTDFQFRCYAGCEGSVEVCSVRAFMADIEAAIHHLGLAPWTLIGVPSSCEL